MAKLLGLFSKKPKEYVPDMACVYAIGYPLTFNAGSNSHYVVERSGGNIKLTADEYNAWVDFFENWTKHTMYDANLSPIKELDAAKAVLLVREGENLLNKISGLVPCRQGFGAESEKKHSIALATTQIYPTGNEWKVWLYSNGISSINDIWIRLRDNGMNEDDFISAVCGLAANNLLFLR